MSPNVPVVLLIEDDPNDIELTTKAFRKAGFENPILTVNNKPDAIDYLRGSGKYSDRSRFPLPELVLLDHRVPGDEGAVLKWVRNEPKFKDLPIAILTGSLNPADQKRSEELKASAYHRKPQNFGELVDLIRRIAEFWLPHGGVRRQRI